VLVITHHPVVPGAIIKVLAKQPVGVLMMEDESGMDEKILAVPVSKLDITFDYILVPCLAKQLLPCFQRSREAGKQLLR